MYVYIHIYHPSPRSGEKGYIYMNQHETMHSAGLLCIGNLLSLAPRVASKVFRARTASNPTHPLAASHYWNKYFPRYDPMHVNDHRGVISHTAGSILSKLVSSCRRLGRTQQQRLNQINALMKEHQKNHNTAHRMPTLRLQDLKATGGWGCLTGRVVKAANTRAMLPFLLELVEEYFGGAESYDRSVRKVVASLVGIQKIFYSSGMFISDEKQTELKTHFERYERHWQNLRHLSDLVRENNWQITPKVHYSCHFVDLAKLINPVSTQCYGEESLIGRVAKIWRASASGPYHATIQRTTLNRYWVGLELRVSIL